MELGGPADLSVSAARLGEVGGCLEDRFKGCRRACSSLSASIMWWFFFDLILLNITLDPVQFFNGCCVLFFWFVQFWLRSWAACWICSICVRRCPHFQPLYKKEDRLFFHPLITNAIQFLFFFMLVCFRMAMATERDTAMACMGLAANMTLRMKCICLQRCRSTR